MVSMMMSFRYFSLFASTWFSFHRHASRNSSSFSSPICTSEMDYKTAQLTDSLSCMRMAQSLMMF